MLSGFAIVCAISSIIPIYILDDLKFFKSVKVRNKMRKIIHKSDSPAKCMKIFILISILLFLLNPYSFKNYGKISFIRRQSIQQQNHPHIIHHKTTLMVI